MVAPTSPHLPGMQGHNDQTATRKRNLQNKNDTLPDISLENVFAEFYRLKKGLEDHPNDETYTDHATIMLVSIVENMFRVRMLSGVSKMPVSLVGSKRAKIELRVSLLVDAARRNDRDWVIADRDRNYESEVRDFLASIGKEVCLGHVCLDVTDGPVH